jgi:insulin-like growth factor 2 receptor
VTIDLSSLKQEGGYTLQAEGYTYTLGICQDIRCDDATAGACQAKPADKNFQSQSLGTSSDVLEFRDGQLTLTYEHGDKCSDSQRQRKTIILFNCGPEAGKGSPSFVREDECHYIFEWRTAYACFGQIDCKAYDAKSGADYHLGDLTRTDANWVVADSREEGKYEYEINVCGPLVPQRGWDCGPFAGACQKVKGGHDYEIGIPSSPFVDADGVLVLHYEHGEACGATKQRSSMIKFECDPRPGALGTPVFEFEADCIYYFSWKTAAACDHDDHQPPVTGDCTTIDSITGQKFDLSGLGTLQTHGKDVRRRPSSVIGYLLLPSLVIAPPLPFSLSSSLGFLQPIITGLHVHCIHLRCVVRDGRGCRR